MRSVSTRVSNVIVGPKRDIPRAILAPNCANIAAFERSIKSKKKNNASLSKMLRPKFTTLDVNTTLEKIINKPAIPAHKKTIDNIYIYLFKFYISVKHQHHEFAHFQYPCSTYKLLGSMLLRLPLTDD
ncbi:hypothetical protein V1478_013347 [Vespula squamosa]|uniref:Uncharacterized protein n=1 Tax=Vespula squamosa TaxID=30214 RepID=A0ABD2AAJ7_VESSQ